MLSARVPLLGAVVTLAVVFGGDAAAARSGMMGLGLGPWWGPYDAYAPPAYAYPPPIYSIPPPPATASRETSESLGSCRELHRP